MCDTANLWREIQKNPIDQCNSRTITILDNDECAAGNDNCHSDATCANTIGSFTCTCNIGYEGDGVNCTGMDFFTKYVICPWN